jgi:hypothetical protein
LHVGAFFGITMYAGIPRSFAAKANAAAWFPLISKNDIRRAINLQYQNFFKK